MALLRRAAPRWLPRLPLRGLAASLLELAGLAAIIGGVALLSIPAACIAGGLLLLVIARGVDE